MKICPNCGFAVADDETTCPKCGEQLPLPPAVTRSAGTAKAVDIFCPNCGEQISNGTKTCPNCGAAIPQAGKSQKSGKPKKRGLIIAAVAAVAVCVGIGIGVISSMMSPPSKKFINYHQNIVFSSALDKLEKNIDIYGKGEFSSDLTITGQTDSEIVNRFLNGSAIKLKLDAHEDEFIANGEVAVAGSPVLTASAYYDDGEVGFSVPELDSNSYVCDLEEMLEARGVQADFDGAELPKISGREVRGLAEAYLDILYTMVNDDNVTVEKSQPFTLGVGGDYTGEIYTCRPTAEDVTATVEKLADHLDQDGALRELILDLAKPALLDEINDTDDAESEINRDIDSLVEEMRSSADDIGNMVAESGLMWKLYVSGDEVHRITLEYDFYDDFITYEDTGAGKSNRTMAFSLGDHYESYRLACEYVLDKGEYSGKLTFDNFEEEIFTLSFKTPGKGRSKLGIPYGSYNLDIQDIPFKTALTVTEDGGEDKHILTLNGIKSTFGGWVDTVNLTINSTQSGTATRMKDTPVDITHYSDDELDKLGEAMGTAFYKNVVGEFGSLLS